MQGDKEAMYRTSGGPSWDFMDNQKAIRDTMIKVTQLEQMHQIQTAENARLEQQFALLEKQKKVALLAEAEEKRHKEMERMKMKAEAELYRRTLEEQAKLN